VLSLALVIVHATGLVFLGTSAAGSFFSDLMQLIIGVALVAVVFRTAARSRGLACSFWYLTAFAYCAWMVPQAFVHLWRHFPDSGSDAVSNQVLVLILASPTHHDPVSQ